MEKYDTRKEKHLKKKNDSIEEEPNLKSDNSKENI
jgi:hypothetical protein